MTDPANGWVQHHQEGERREEYRKGEVVVWYGTNSWRIAVGQRTYTDGRNSLSVGYAAASDAMRAVDRHLGGSAVERAEARVISDEGHLASMEAALAVAAIEEERGTALIHALARLHAAGRIVRPWLNGMFVVDSPSTKPPGTYRAGPPQRVYAQWLPPNARWRLSDVEEPATKGCLLALLREASGDPYLGTVFVHGSATADGKSGWSITSSNVPTRVTVAPSEGAALADALIALGRDTAGV